MFGMSKNERLNKALEKRSWDKAGELIAKGAVPYNAMLEELVVDPAVTTDELRLVLKAGATPNFRDLHLAVTTDSVASFGKARVLVAAGARSCAETLEYVVNTHQSAYGVNLLVGAGAKPTSELLFDAVRNNDIAVAKALIDGGAFSNSEMRDYAVNNLDRRWLKTWTTLLESAKIPATPERLHQAIEHEEEDIVRELLDAGVVPTEETLGYAVEYLDDWEAARLIRAGAKAQPFMLGRAVYREYPQMAQLLVASGVVPAQETLSYAIENLDAEWVQLLLDAGAKTEPDMLDTAVYNENWHMASLLAKRVTPKEQTLAYAVENLEEDWVNMLLEAGAVADADMLHTAVYNGKWQRAKMLSKLVMLLQAGTAPTADALYTAVHNRDWHAARVLAEHGAQPDDKTLHEAGLGGSHWVDMLKSASMEFGKAAAKKPVIKLSAPAMEEKAEEKKADTPKNDNAAPRRMEFGKAAAKKPKKPVIKLSAPATEEKKADAPKNDNAAPRRKLVLGKPKPPA